MSQQNYAPVTRCQAITDIFESIAKQEDALAKILKEAGEKPHFDKEYPHYDSTASDDRCSGYGPSYGPGPWPDKDKCKDKDKDKDEERETIALLSAVTRLEFLIVAKAYLFAECACPQNGCQDQEKPHK